MGSRGFSPSALFANGEKGVWYDPSDLSTMFQNSDGTTTAAVGDPVGYIADKSGNSNHAIQATSAKRPTLRQAGSLYYLEFDGAQGLQTPFTVDFTGTDSMSVFSGVRKELDASENIVELSDNVGGNTGAFRLSTNINDQWRYGSRGDGTVKNATATGYAAPSTNVVTGISDISDDISRIRVLDDFTFTNTGDQGAGNYGNYELNIGARNDGGGLQLNGFIYGLIVRGATSSSKEVDSTEAYMAAKSGVTL